MNNYEKIKSMSIDEMAELMSDDCEYYCNAKNCSGACINGIKQWLESEGE